MIRLTGAPESRHRVPGARGHDWSVMTIKKALKLDSGHVEEHMHLARLHLAGSKDRNLAGKRLKPSLALPPNHPVAGEVSVLIGSLAEH